MFTVYVCPCYVVHPLVTHHGNSLRQSPCCAMCSQVAKSNLGKSIPGAWQILITRALWRLVDSAHCISWITTSFWKKMMFCVWKNHKNVNHNLSVLFELDNLDIWCPKMTPPFASPKHPTTLPLCAFCRSLNAMYLLAKAVMKTSASEAEILKKAIRNKKEDKKFCFQHFVFQNHPKSKCFQIFINLGIMMCLCSIGFLVFHHHVFCLIELYRPRRSSVKELAMHGSWVWPNKHLPLCKI